MMILCSIFFLLSFISSLNSWLDIRRLEISYFLVIFYFLFYHFFSELTIFVSLWVLSVIKRNPLFFHSISCKNNGFLFTTPNINENKIQTYSIILLYLWHTIFFSYRIACMLLCWKLYSLLAMLLAIDLLGFHDTGYYFFGMIFHCEFFIVRTNVNLVPNFKLKCQCKFKCYCQFFLLNDVLIYRFM